MKPVHHVGLCPVDMAESLRFYVDGVGLEVLIDATLPVDLEPLIGVPTSNPRTVFLGRRGGPEEGMLELLDLGTERVREQEPAPGVPRRGLCLVSFQVPVEPALQRLADLGMGGPPRRFPTPAGGIVATVVDPDGVLVELLDAPMSLGRRSHGG